MSAAAVSMEGAREVRPDEPAAIGVTVSNVGDTVESYDLVVLGELSAFSTVLPPEIRLFPGEQGTATATVVATTALPAGPVTFAVKAMPQSGVSPPVVEERELQVAAVTRFEIRTVPAVLRTRRRGQVRVDVENTGNAPVTVTLSADDPNEELATSFQPAGVTVDPHGVAAASLNVRALDRHASQIGYTVRGRSSDGDEAQVDARMELRRRRPLPIIMAAAAVLIALIVGYSLSRGEDSEAIRLVDSGSPTSEVESTTVPVEATTTTAVGAAGDQTSTTAAGTPTSTGTAGSTPPTTAGRSVSTNGPNTGPSLTRSATTAAPPPRPPCRSGLCAYVLKDSPSTIVVDTGMARDSNGDEVVISGFASRTAHGNVTMGNDKKTLFYKPDPGFVGQDLLTYSVSDSRGGTATADLTIHVVTA